MKRASPRRLFRLASFANRGFCRFAKEMPIRLFEVADQRHIAIDQAARQGELLAIARPSEIEDESVPKVGHLFRRAAVERLCPEVGCPIACDGISKRAAIRRPVD